MAKEEKTEKTFYSLDTNGNLEGDETTDPREDMSTYFFLLDVKKPLLDLDCVTPVEGEVDTKNDGLRFNQLVADMDVTLKVPSEEEGKHLQIVGGKIVSTYIEDDTPSAEILLPGGETLHCDCDYAAFEKKPESTTEDIKG
jgi:hypothetical protein